VALLHDFSQSDNESNHHQSRVRFQKRPDESLLVRLESLEGSTRNSNMISLRVIIKAIIRVGHD